MKSNKKVVDASTYGTMEAVYSRETEKAVAVFQTIRGEKIGSETWLPKSQIILTEGLVFVTNWFLNKEFSNVKILTEEEISQNQAILDAHFAAEPEVKIKPEVEVEEVVQTVEIVKTATKSEIFKRAHAIAKMNMATTLELRAKNAGQVVANYTRLCMEMTYARQLKLALRIVYSEVQRESMSQIDIDNEKWLRDREEQTYNNNQQRLAKNRAKAKAKRSRSFSQKNWDFLKSF